MVLMITIRELWNKNMREALLAMITRKMLYRFILALVGIWMLIIGYSYAISIRDIGNIKAQLYSVSVNYDNCNPIMDCYASPAPKSTFTPNDNGTIELVLESDRQDGPKHDTEIRIEVFKSSNIEPLQSYKDILPMGSTSSRESFSGKYYPATYYISNPKEVGRYEVRVYAGRVKLASTSFNIKE